MRKLRPAAVIVCRTRRGARRALPERRGHPRRELGGHDPDEGAAAFLRPGLTVGRECQLRSMLLRMRTILVLVALVAALAPAADANSSKRFVSKRYSYSVALTAGWTSSPASTSWRGGPPFQDPPEVDLYEGSDGRSLAVAARSVPRATLRQWSMMYVGAAVPSFCTKPHGYRATTLGGVSALAFTARCEIHDINVELAVRGGRGYAMALASPSADSQAADGAVFETARRSFRFVR